MSNQLNSHRVFSTFKKSFKTLGLTLASSISIAQAQAVGDLKVQEKAGSWTSGEIASAREALRDSDPKSIHALATSGDRRLGKADLKRLG